MKDRDISRRDFLKGMGAVTVGVAALGLFGGCAAGGESSAAASAGGASGGGRTVLAFASDTHAETAGFEAWLTDQKAVYGDDLAHLGFAGDICDKAWDQSVFDGFKAVLDRHMPGKYSVTTGNQENKPGAPGANWADIGPGFVRAGEAVRGEDYAIYALGAAQEEMRFPQEDIDALAAYLESAPKNIPIFVVSHYPLHLSVATAAHSIPGGDHRQAAGNDALIDVLNGYPNVIFLWAHNHTFQDPRYGTIRPAGSKFTYEYTEPTAKKQIGFIYASNGSFCRGYTYGAVAEIRRDGDRVTVKLYYVDTNEPLAVTDSADITVAADGSVTTAVTEGTWRDMDEALAMSGYPTDPDFAAEF